MSYEENGWCVSDMLSEHHGTCTCSCPCILPTHWPRLLASHARLRHSRVNTPAGSGGRILGGWARLAVLGEADGVERAARVLALLRVGLRVALRLCARQRHHLLLACTTVGLKQTPLMCLRLYFKGSASPVRAPRCDEPPRPPAPPPPAQPHGQIMTFVKPSRTMAVVLHGCRDKRAPHCAALPRASALPPPPAHEQAVCMAAAR